MDMGQGEQINFYPSVHEYAIVIKALWLLSFGPEASGKDGKAAKLKSSVHVWRAEMLLMFCLAV